MAYMTSSRTTNNTHQPQPYTPSSLNLSLSPTKRSYAAQINSTSTARHEKEHYNPLSIATAAWYSESSKPTWIREELQKEKAFFENTINEHRDILEKASGVPFPVSGNENGYRRSRPGPGYRSGYRSWTSSQSQYRSVGIGMSISTNMAMNMNTTPGSRSASYSASSSSSRLGFETETEFDSMTVTTPGTDTDTQRTTPKSLPNDSSRAGIEEKTEPDSVRDILSAGLDEVDYALWAIAEKQRETRR